MSSKHSQQMVLFGFISRCPFSIIYNITFIIIYISIKYIFDATDHDYFLLSYINHLILCWHILLYIYNSSVSFFGLSCIFEQWGGAVMIYLGSGTFTTCSFMDNEATDVSSTTIIKTLFSSCHNI
jgi:hypothetical protein